MTCKAKRSWLSKIATMFLSTWLLSFSSPTHPAFAQAEAGVGELWLRADKAGCRQFEVSLREDAYMSGPDKKHLQVHGLIVTYDPACLRSEIHREKR